MKKLAMASGAEAEAGRAGAGNLRLVTSKDTKTARLSEEGTASRALHPHSTSLVVTR